jgi:hypothetical protein
VTIDCGVVALEKIGDETPRLARVLAAERQ